MYDIAWSPNGSRLASAHASHTIAIWNVEEKEEISHFTVHAGATVSVLYDPEAPPDRRYVMTGEDLRYRQVSGGWSLAKNSSVTRIDTSPDGLHWTSAREGPGVIQQQHEAHTIYKFGGLYHLGGHQISPLLRLPEQTYGLGLYLGPRTFVVWRSPRLDLWPIEHTKAFFKPMRSSSPYRKGWDREEVHLGAAVTVRGNGSPSHLCFRL